MNRTINIPGYIALFSLSVVTFVMAAGVFDLLQFLYKTFARILNLV